MGLLLIAAGFSALGVWQVHRRVWKRDLIAQIDARIHAPPVAAPAPPAWPAIDAAHDAYRRVQVAGVFLNDRTTLVQAVTTLGGGYWVMTPLRTAAGFTVLINRGFVPPGRPDMIARGEGPAAPTSEVTGLLRITEPKGGFLQSNAPADNRWYSRDVAAIARAKQLPDVAPYFIDADPTPRDEGGPVGGLTVVDLPNNHLVYLITWFSLAAMSVGGALLVVLDALRGARTGETRPTKVYIV
jgi:surfeit locus 1 family protein